MGKGAIASRQLLDGAQAQHTKASFGPGTPAEARETAIYVSWRAGVTSGAVIVETAMDENYPGTWALLATVTFSGTAPRLDIVQITGVMVVVRTRVSSAVVGGVVDTWVVSN